MDFFKVVKQSKKKKSRLNKCGWLILTWWSSLLKNRTCSRINVYCLEHFWFYLPTQCFSGLFIGIKVVFGIFKLCSAHKYAVLCIKAFPCRRSGEKVECKSNRWTRSGWVNYCPVRPCNGLNFLFGIFRTHVWNHV